jgi:hypothetical protein
LVELGVEDGHAYCLDDIAERDGLDHGASPREERHER